MTKPKKNETTGKSKKRTRVSVNNLPREGKELTAEEARVVRGGRGDGSVRFVKDTSGVEDGFVGGVATSADFGDGSVRGLGASIVDGTSNTKK